MRLDYSYRRNGTQGFIQSLALARDPSQAKILAYTADAIRETISSTEFIAITEIEPHAQDNERHKFVAGIARRKTDSARAAIEIAGVGASDETLDSVTRLLRVI